MSFLTYELSLAGIVIVSLLLLAGLIFPLRKPSPEDPLGYLDEWDPRMEMTRRHFLILQREDALRAGIDPLSSDYPPMRDEHLTSDGKPLKFL